MDKDRPNSFLELQIIWKDDDMIELKVTASNGRFSGTTEVYDTAEALFNFAQALIGFPKDNNKLFHEAGNRNSDAYFSMNFYRIDNAGHVGVEINLEYSETGYRHEEKDKLKLEIIVLPSTIDNFQKELSQLATTQEGIAILG